MLEFLNTPFGMTALIGLAGVVLLVIAFITLANGEQVDPMQKFSEQTKSAPARNPTNNRQLRRKASREIKALDSFSRFLEPENEKDLSAARMKMIQAGYHGKNAVRDLTALQFILAIGAFLVSLLVGFVLLPDTFDSTLTLSILMIAPMLIGYMAPRRWIENRVEARKTEIISGFPDALDMMLICVEAGQSLDQSIQRVSREMKSAYPALGEELGAVGEQVKAGRERSDVLRDMAKRCDIPDITSFVTVMVQAATYGTSITEALRIFASEMRDKRIMRAEEKANILPTKMTLGTMMFTVPPLLIILIGPSVVGIATELNPAAISGN